MKTKLFNVLLFTAGGAIGSLVTWKVLKTRYERIAQEEIDSVKETWAQMNRHDTDEPVEGRGMCDECDDEEYDDNAIEQMVMTDYTSLASKYSRGTGETTENDEEGERGTEDDVPYINGPYVIDPSDFGDGNFEHELHCINYYSDGILADDWGVILDIEETIGEDSLKHFGDYADDIVHVRNERLRIDYEVVEIV